MNSKYRKYITYTAAVGVLTLSSVLGGCTKESSSEAGDATPSEVNVIQAVPETIAQLGLNGQVLPGLNDINLPDAEPAPEYLRIGVRHEIIKRLQQRLMDLGFMDNDEPTDYFGEMTQQAVKHFQRQNELPTDGIVGNVTWDAIMSPDAKYYAVSKGTQGDDIERIQQRLYELGYLATADLVTGNFGDSTEAAVLKLQEVNGLEQDGKVGQRTINLLYSDEIKPNFLSYGEKSDVVLACQERLKELGYLTTTPDGAYGEDTVVAVKQFQARNDQVVDGYLGPSTRIALNSPDARANGLMLGERGDAVTKVQQLLNKHGYLVSGNVTGYYGEATENAVRNFQSRNGLTSDGLVGVQTMAKLTGDNVRRPAANSGGSGTTTYGENIGVMAATKVYSTAAYWCAAGFALLLSLCPKFGAIINTIPAGVLGGVTTLLYGMIGMVGIRIWVENKVNFDKPLNIMVAAITMIIAIGQFAFAFNGISFNGIAIGTIVILVAYHGLKAIGKATGTIDKNDPDIL